MSSAPSRWHLPPIAPPCDPLPDIPCFCSPNDYDTQGFFDYPTRKGWQFNSESTNGPIRYSPDTGQPIPTTDNQKAAFIQAWLFFGMLYEAFRILGVEVNLEDFVDIRDETDCYITTYPARAYFQQCYNVRDSKFSARSPQHRLIAHQELAKLFKRVQGLISRFEDRDSRVPMPWRISQVLTMDAILSIQVLGESFLNYAKSAIELQADAGGVPSQPLAAVGFPWIRRLSSPLQARMIRGGWCPSTTQMLHSLLDTTGLFVASRLKMFDGVTKQDHRGCTELQCLANQVDEGTYETKHVPGCRGCGGHVEVDVQKITQILLKGGIPLVNIIEESSGVDGVSGDAPAIRLEVVADAPYIALSHVWAQGLGNAQANSLPACQLRKIKQMSNQLVMTDLEPADSTTRIKVAIWVDTLCIPVDPNLKQVRKLAITQLAKTYREADHVLVLETGLMSSATQASRMEKCTRLLCSAWVRRLWTYQEAILSKNGSHCDKLQLQFSDGPVHFESLLRAPNSLCHSEQALWSLLLALPLTKDEAFRLSTLARALKYRTTSRQEDEAICLSSVLGLDMAKVTQLRTSQERMIAFYSQIKTIPRNLIFRNMPRLDVDGYRWAPPSFLQQSAEIATRSAEAARDARGMYVTGIDVLKFQSLSAPIWPHQHFIMTVASAEDSKAASWRLTIAGTRSGTTETEWRRIVAEWNAFDKCVIDVGNRGAVLLNDEKGGFCTVVEVLEEQGDTRFCKFVTLADVTVEKDITNCVGKQGMITAEMVPAKSKGRWCVG